MFSIIDQNHSRISRRTFLEVGSLGTGMLGLPGLLTARESSPAESFIRDKAVVFLFVQGGFPQIETFDPKMQAPGDIRSCTGEVATTIPGITFGGTFGQLAQRADKLAVVRSFASGDGGHNQLPVITGRNSTGASMGAQYVRLAGANHPTTAIPRHMVVLPEQLQPELKLGTPTGPFRYDYIRENYPTSGKLGSAYQGMLLDGGRSLVENLTLQLPRGRFDDRRRLLAQLDQFKRRFDSTGEFDSATAAEQQAVDVLLKGIADAFDISREDPRTVARYDTSHLFRMEDWHKGGSRYNGKVNQSRITNLLGKQMLLARRLCEAGCGFVTVHDACWDFHNDGNNPSASKAMPVLGPQLDHAIAAFLDDVAERGLSDKILLVVTSEMGRSPKKDNRGGTGHWARLTPLLMAGGGLKMGQVVGQTDAQAGAAITRTYGPENLQATIMQTLFDAGETRLVPGLPTAITRTITNGTAIQEIV